MRLGHYSLILFFATLCTDPLAAVLPLRDQWWLACSRLAAGDSPAAHQLFSEFQRWYGQEQSVKEPEFAERLLRYRALAAFGAGDYPLARRLMETWFSRFPDAPAFGAFLRYQLAAACHAMEDAEARQHHWKRFLADYPDLPEAILVRWQWADAALAERDFATAARQLQAVLQHPALQPSGAVVARCALASVSVLANNRNLALQSLKGEASGAAKRILQAWRALLAPGMAARFLQQNQPGEALQVAHWFDRPGNAAAALRRLLADNSRNHQPDSIRRALWHNHWNRQLQRFLQQLTAADEATSTKATNQTPWTLHLLRLRALYSSDDAAASRVLAELLLQLDPQDPKVQAVVWEYAVKACQDMADWSAAQKHAEAFLRRFPDHPEVSRMLALNARAASLRERFPEAIRILRQLLNSVPEHPARPRWRRQLAEALLRDGQAASALAEFRSLREEAPESWDAFLTLRMAHAAGAIQPGERADQLFASVASRPGSNHNLREAALAGRLRNALVTADSSPFLSLLTDYHKSFPRGRLRSVVLLMASGFHQRRGHFAEAITAARAVWKSDPHQAVPAARRLLFLYQKTNDHSQILKLVADLLKRARDFPDPLPAAVFQQATATCMADPQHRLSAPSLVVLREQLFSEDPPFAPADALAFLQQTWSRHSHALAGGTPFADWLDQTIQQTEFLPARAAFLLFKAKQLDQSGRPHSADALRLRLLRLDPDQPWPAPVAFALAATAARYDFPDARSRMRSFLDRFPDHPDRPEAALLLARAEYARGHSEQARNLLRTVVRDFADADCFIEAGRLLAQVQLDRNRPAAAATTATRLLEQPSLPAADTAALLALRAQADRQTGQILRAAVACRRILTLYPAFPKPVRSARKLLQVVLPDLPPQQQPALRQLLDPSSPS